MANNKRQDIELLRIFSTFAIVWYHSGAIGHEIAYSGLIVFIILSFYLDGKSQYQEYGDIVYKKIHRLIVPWLVWFLIYGALNILTNRPFIVSNDRSLIGILTGTRIHLWYLPFIFFWLVIYDIFIKNTQSKFVAILSVFVFVTILFNTAIWRPYSFHLGYPFAQYMHATAGVVLGIYFSKFETLSGKINIFSILLMTLASIYAIPYDGVGIPYLIGIICGLIVVLNLIKIPTQISFDFIAKNTFGVYFIHIAFLAIIVKFNLASGTFIPVLTFIISLGTIALLRWISPRYAKYWI